MSESIKIIHSDSSTEILEELNKFQKNKDICVIILNFANEFNSEKADGLVEKIESFPKPIIALINEKAKDFLFEIVLASHICIATENAEFEISNKEKLLKQIGSKNIQKLKLYENNIDAKTAFDLGIINKVISHNDIEKGALEMADKISKLAPLAIEFCLYATNQGLELKLEEGLNLETKLFSRVFATEDMREGTSAFLEKRRPKFSGR